MVLDFLDLMIEDGVALSLFHKVDIIHTMTSLVGLEGLLRNKKVYTYGMPFYAGWGLTIDLMKCERRVRKLKLNELVAGALIEYPTYLSNTSKMYTSPETVVDELVEQKKMVSSEMPLWRKFFRDLIRIWKHLNICRKV